jgi:hypothetical protein
VVRFRLGGSIRETAVGAALAVRGPGVIARPRSITEHLSRKTGLTLQACYRAFGGE